MYRKSNCKEMYTNQIQFEESNKISASFTGSNIELKRDASRNIYNLCRLCRAKSKIDAQSKCEEITRQCQVNYKAIVPTSARSVVAM
jgi:hypothetical protein